MKRASREWHEGDGRAAVALLQRERPPAESGTVPRSGAQHLAGRTRTRRRAWVPLTVPRASLAATARPGGIPLYGLPDRGGTRHRPGRRWLRALLEDRKPETARPAGPGHRGDAAHGDARHHAAPCQSR